MVWYFHSMRSLLVALLIVLFAGVHTAAAFGVAHVDADAIGHSASMQHDMPSMAGNANSHHLNCCEKAGKPGSSGKISSCSADCVSFYVDNIVYQFSAEVTRESTPLRKLASLQPQPHDHPPKPY